MHSLPWVPHRYVGECNTPRRHVTALGSTHERDGRIRWSSTTADGEPAFSRDRYLTIAAWHEHDRGGHFPAAAEPRLLAERLRESLRPFRYPTD
jgi:hypothetical protein